MITLIYTRSWAVSVESQQYTCIVLYIWGFFLYYTPYYVTEFHLRIAVTPLLPLLRHIEPYFRQHCNGLLCGPEKDWPNPTGSWTVAIHNEIRRDPPQVDPNHYSFPFSWKSYLLCKCCQPKYFLDRRGAKASFSAFPPGWCNLGLVWTDGGTCG